MCESVCVCARETECVRETVCVLDSVCVRACVRAQVFRDFCLSPESLMLITSSTTMSGLSEGVTFLSVTPDGTTSGLLLRFLL